MLVRVKVALSTLYLISPRGGARRGSPGNEAMHACHSHENPIMIITCIVTIIMSRIALLHAVKASDKDDIKRNSSLHNMVGIYCSWKQGLSCAWKQSCFIHSGLPPYGH